MDHPMAHGAAATGLTRAQVAARSGASERLMRHCEALGLLDEPARAVPLLRFVRRAQALGFEPPEVVELLALWRDERRASFDVKRVALARAEALGERIEELAQMKRGLERLAHCCGGDQRPACPILDELAELKGFAGCAAAAAASAAFSAESGRPS
jgi:DNA-binding transcriptional MerR regulator